MTRGYLEAIAERMGGGMKASQACCIHIFSARTQRFCLTSPSTTDHKIPPQNHPGAVRVKPRVVNCTCDPTPCAHQPADKFAPCAVPYNFAPASPPFCLALETSFTIDAFCRWRVT